MHTQTPQNLKFVPAILNILFYSRTIKKSISFHSQTINIIQQFQIDVHDLLFKTLTVR